MPNRDTDHLQAARAAVTEAAQERIRKLGALTAARSERDKLARERGSRHSDVEEADRRYAGALAELKAARTLEQEANARLRVRLAELPEPSVAIAGLNREYPILLFPVRIETRFIRFDDPIFRPPLLPQVGELRVRIYPDGISTDAHEPQLSASELEAGRDYWTTAWRDASERDAWTALVAEVRAPRAAWIVRQCEPTNVAALPRSPAAALIAPAPVFPVREPRPPNWHRTPVARLLPDRWVVQAYPNEAVSDEERMSYRVLSRAVAEPLALSLAFTADGVTDNRTELAADLKVDPDIQWTFNFQLAEEVGMAVRIPLADRDFKIGIDSVFVLGVQASLEPEQSAQQLQELLEHHRVSRGLAFVPQGTPTNNTAQASSGYPPPDPRAAASFRVERGLALARSGRDGARFMEALGLAASAADHVSGADRDEQGSARAMATALWPATIGYYLKQMLASSPDLPAQPADLSDETIEALRRHFVDLVRGRGPFPAFRIGDVPYGLLPVSLLETRSVAGDVPVSEFDATLSRVVADLGQTLGLLAEDYAPRVGRTSDPDADLLATFKMDASAREVYVRPAVGEETIDNVGGFVGNDDARGIHEPISLDAPISVGGPPGPDAPEVAGLTLRRLLGFPASEPDVVDERVDERRPTEGGGPNG